MYYYKTTIQYAGTNYAGFQWQNGTPTVQSAFNESLSKILNGKFTTMAASRTDTGVHALDQVVKITSSDPIDLITFINNFNEALPNQIRCLKIENCDGLFRPSASSLSKEYRYFFTNKTQVSKVETQFIANIANKLDVEAMKICVQALIGTHNFKNFYSSGSNVKSTIRHVIVCELSEINPQEVFSNEEIFQIPKDLNNCYQLKIEANGFLKQMIRHIVSSLWMVGSGKLSTNEFIELLYAPKSDKQLWKVASPNGLYLYRINYPSPNDP